MVGWPEKLTGKIVTAKNAPGDSSGVSKGKEGFDLAEIKISRPPG